MIARLLSLVAVAAIVSSTRVGRLYRDDQASLKYMWQQFKSDWGKRYDSADAEARRFEHFVENLRLADGRNDAEAASNGTATHGITKFSDLSQAEFAAHYLTSNKKYDARSTIEVPAPMQAASVSSTAVNWAGSLTTPVKDQGYCGSCWAFSATEQIESDGMRTLGTSYILGPQQIVSCDRTSEGCDGGWTSSAYVYVKAAGGLETEDSYPYASYQGLTHTCSADKSKEVLTVQSFTKITTGEAAMSSYVLSTGPLSVCLDASSWSSYTGGVLTVCGKQVDHCVQAVGVNIGASEPYWIVRNSWGTSWGESGYIQLSYGSNTCNIASDPTWTVVSKV